MTDDDLQKQEDEQPIVPYGYTQNKIRKKKRFARALRNHFKSLFWLKNAIFLQIPFSLKSLNISRLERFSYWCSTNGALKASANQKPSSQYRYDNVQMCENILNVKKNSFGDCKCYFLVLWMCNVGDIHLASIHKSHG